MAKANSKAAAMLLNLNLMVSLLLLVSATEGRLFSSGFGKPSIPDCTTVYGVRSSDTCFAVRQEFKLTAKKFSRINPNLVCEKLFVGQWLCVAGTV